MKIDSYIDDKCGEMQRMVHANIDSVNLSRKEQRAEDRAKLRAMQERLNSWVDQIESRVN